MVLLIKYIFVLFTQKPSYKKNITKLKIVKAATIKNNKNIYLGHSNQIQYIILTISRSAKS